MKGKFEMADLNVCDLVGAGMTHTQGTIILREKLFKDGSGATPKASELCVQEVTADVLREKYLKDGETTEGELFQRVGTALASVEEDREFWAREFVENMNRGAIGAGRIMSSAGTGVDSSLLNCFVQPVGDCIQGYDAKGRPGIYEALREAAETMRRGGGVGYDFSGIRPKGAWVKGTDSVASGPCSYINVFDQSCSTVESAGSRRGAQMGVLRIDHPDIVEFIEAKRTKGRWNNFNVSVGVTDAFMDAVKGDLDWQLVHECPKTKEDALALAAGDSKLFVYDVVRARDLWDRIMRSAYDYAEPGILFLDNINRDNNLRAIETISATNPCVTADTWVMTGDGARRVGELVGVTFEAMVDGKLYGLESEGFFSTGVKEVLELVTEEGFKLRLTADHLVLVTKIGFEGGVVDSWVKAGDLKKGDLVVLHSHKGNLSWGASNVDSLGSLIDSSIASGKGFALGDTLIPWDSLPSAVECESSDFLLGFLRGLFNRYPPQVHYHEEEAEMDSVHKFFWSFGEGEEKEFLCGLQRVLQRFGVHAIVSNYFDDMVPRLEVCDLDSLIRLRTVIGGLGSSMTIAMEWLSENWKQWTEIHKPVAFRPTATVASITPAGTEEVYDVTVEKVHAFDANGMYVHNCGEQPLPNYGCCDLGPLILTSFVRKPFEGGAWFDFNSFMYAVWVQVRALDNVLDVTYWALPQQRDEAFSKRRIGVGFTGLGDTLVMLGYGYDTEDGREFARYIAETMRDVAYRASIALAVEKGSFPLLEGLDFVGGETTFASRLPEGLKLGIREYGIRNSHLLSIAPTGTVSLAFADNASNGIEPAFSWSYERRKREADGSSRVYDVEDHAYRVWRAKTGKDYKDASFPKTFVSALDIKVEGHLRMLETVQPFIDTSISKTVNIPADYPFEGFKDLYLSAYCMGLKGLATYRPNAILGSVLSVKSDEVKKEGSPVVSVEKGDDMYSVIAKRPKGGLPSITEKVEYWTSMGLQVIYLTVSFMPLEDGRYRALEFFIPAGQARESQQWITTSMRLLSLAARGGFLERALEDMRKVTWDRGSVRLGHLEKADGTRVPMWHDSEVAAVGYAIQRIIEGQKISWSGNASLESVESPKVDASVSVGGSKCGECGAWAVVKRDGCGVCLECGAVGSCG